MKSRAIRETIAVTLLCLWSSGNATAHQKSRASTGPARPMEAIRGYQPLSSALHVHSRFSNGQYEIFELAAYAHQRKIDVLGITDSFLTRVRYGIGPWKKLISRVIERDSVLSRGIDKYLGQVATAQRQFPNVLLVPGLEVAPHYFWQGSYGNELRLFGFDRHFTIFGLRETVAIQNLPVIENETWANTTRDWRTAVVPAALLLLGLLLPFVGRRRMGQLTDFKNRKNRRFWLLSFLLILAGVLWLQDAYPFGALSDPYSGKHDVQAYQRVVDYVHNRQGVVFWSYPEARYPAVLMGGAQMISSEHPEDLLLVDRYDGFEGIYGDRITITQPGNIWDQVLVAYLQGTKKTWPSVITGIDFHTFKDGGGWYELDRGQTILWARRKDEEAVLESLRFGRGYAVFQGNANGEITLRNFAAHAGSETAIAGETLRASVPVTLTANIEENARTQEENKRLARLEIVLDGKLIDLRELPLPILINRTDALVAGRHYYRIRVKHANAELLSNPIFIEFK
jgi:hypothetical protein